MYSLEDWMDGGAIQQDRNIGQGEVDRRWLLGENHKINLAHVGLEMPVSRGSGSASRKKDMCVMLSRVM